MKTILRSDLSCPSCVSKIEKQLHRLEGVDKAKVHFSTGRIEVDHDDQQAGADDLLDTIRKAGYEARISPF